MLGLNRKRRVLGFTVTELVVVTGIVTSTGSGGYMGVKDRAKRTQCQQNLRQVGMAIQMHEMMNGALPSAKFYPKEPREDGQSILNLLPGYERCMVCPCMPHSLQAKGLTFLWNDRYGGKGLSAIPNPSQTWLMIEMSAVSKDAPPPHQGGYNVLCADLQVRHWTNLPPELKAKPKPKKKSSSRRRR